jgi:single-stranded-DNA-specific exonuclease
MSLFDQILTARGLVGDAGKAFLNPNYDEYHDPFLLPDMDKAVERLVHAKDIQEKITIYGDYDIDGLTATTVLLEAFERFGFENVDAFIPNRFVEGYGLTSDAVERIALTKSTLIVTVDCGSLSEKEIIRASELGVDVIVTDHHNVAKVQPSAVAVINPKRPDHTYPFIDLAGVGVAFKLVQALQTRLDGLEIGQEKWLLDLVALGTVCDVVTLTDENRTFVYWGLKVMAKLRRPGLKALMAVAAIEPSSLNARSLGFGLGPRMNASGRLETAQYSLDMLRAQDGAEAFEKAQRLDEFNKERRSMQDTIFKEALIQAELYKNEPVLVVSGKDWNHGIVGIVAAKLLEKYKKPSYVLEEMGEEAKGSARSYGDFSAADAIRASEHLITKGGGHKLAAGVSLPTANIEAFRKSVNDFYKSQKLKNQEAFLIPKPDVTIESFSGIDEEFVKQLETLEPFGHGNPEPLFVANNVVVTNLRKMGSDSQHVKLELRDALGNHMQFISFSAPAHFFAEPGEQVNILFQPTVNEWQGRRTVEGRLIDVIRL